MPALVLKWNARMLCTSYCLMYGWCNCLNKNTGNRNFQVLLARIFDLKFGWTGIWEIRPTHWKSLQLCWVVCWYFNTIRLSLNSQHIKEINNHLWNNLKIWSPHPSVEYEVQVWKQLSFLYTLICLFLGLAASLVSYLQAPFTTFAQSLAFINMTFIKFNDCN